jgi:CRP/FNR family transcriptional regulator
MKHSEKIIAGLGRLKRYAQGSFLFQAEEKAAGFYYVETGEVRVFKMDEQGRELDVARLGPGEFLGEAIAFVSGRFPFYAQVVKDSEIAFFEIYSVFGRIESDPAMARFFIELLARKCVALSNRVESLGLRTIRQRLIQYLLAHCYGSGHCLVELKIKKGDLAKLLGTISETLSRGLKQMQEEGLIKVDGPKIHIRDCQKLREELSV